jgi:four helix bundle protein
MSYRDLEVWKLARKIGITVHRMAPQNLPKFEMYEEGSQIRRSAKSISANIVEGYGRRAYTGRSDIPDPGSRITHLAS